MIFDLLGIDKKLGIWICASIVSVSLLSTTIIWAKTYYDVRADAVAVVEVAKEKKDAIGKSFDRARKASREVFDKLIVAGILEKAQRDQFGSEQYVVGYTWNTRMCVKRTQVDAEGVECGLHTFETMKACRDFEKWLHRVDWHGKNIYICTDAEIVAKCEGSTSWASVDCITEELSRKLGEE